MNIKELKTLKKKILDLREQLEAAESETADDGAVSSEISDVNDELRRLQAEWDKAIGRLSYDDDRANCIYLHYVKGYSWKDLAKLSADCGIAETPYAVMKRCQRYEW